jgi:small subunit ribosomal protein S9
VATVKGGGKSGQCGAVVHAASRALAGSDDELKAVLKKGGFLSRDSRMKERKKPGQPGARKRFQFSKR